MSKIKLQVGLMSLLVAFSASVQSGQIYKWQDKSGKWHFTQTPPDPSIEVQTIGRKNASASSEEKQTQKLFPITLYANDCGVGCKEAEEFLKKHEIAYTKKDPSKDPKIFEEFKEKSPQAMAPTLLIGDEVIVGFRQDEWAGKLKDAGFKIGKEK